MKYYIPTTTLNIDNIFSTESISPRSYYPKRGFKPNFFESIPYMVYDDVILLFSKIPYYKLDGSEFEQYPIVLEIEDDQQFQDLVEVYICEDFSIYSCNHTIYLTPWNTQILVFDYGAYEHSKIIIESSRNCKIGGKFIWKKAENFFPYENMISCIDKVLSSSIDNRDKIVNIVKGTLWGHILGLSRSKTPEVANLLRLANEMRNIVSSAISNGGVCKPLFYEKLENLNEDYKKIADGKVYTQWDVECSAEESLILKKFNVFKEAILKFLRINNYSLSPELPAAQSDKNRWISYREELLSHTMTCIKSRSDFNIESVSFNLLIFDNKTILIKDYELASEVLRLICCGDIDKELLRIDKTSAMKKVLSAVSSILRHKYGDEEWNKNPEERKYINALGKNIINFEPFNINSIDNYELKSIASYILKGEDYESLIRYLEDNGIYDYDLVLSLWGATEGYASIHKNLVSAYVTPTILSKINAFVGISSNGKLFPLQKQISKNDFDLANNDDITDNNVYNANVAKTIENYQENSIIYKQLLTLKVGKKSISKDIIAKIYTIFIDNNSLPDDVFYKKLSSVHGVGKAVIEAVKKSIGYCDNSFFKEPSSQISQTNLLESDCYSDSIELPYQNNDKVSTNNKSIINNQQWIYECSEIIKNQKAKKEFIDDMEWFVHNHKETNKNRNVSNLMILERLKVYMENKLRPNSKAPWKADIYKNIPINEILDFMYRVYGK